MYIRYVLPQYCRHFTHCIPCISLLHHIVTFARLSRVGSRICHCSRDGGRAGGSGSLQLASRLPSPPMADIAAPPLAAAPPPLDPTQAVPSIVAPVPVPVPEEQASETLYIQNLNEKIKIPVLKASLRGLFKSYGEVLDVVAHSNLRMRGQAFVSFPSADIAKKALKEVRGFPLYSKPMVCFFLLCYATCQSPSDY